MTEAGARPIRVLLAKPGLDGHDRGIKVLIKSLRDAGMEVIYTGLRATPAGIALAAAQEDVDAVGVSNLSGAHLSLFPAVAAALREQSIDLGRVVLFGGGTIPPDDTPRLLASGLRRVFGPSSTMREIVEFLNEEVKR